MNAMSSQCIAGVREEALFRKIRLAASFSLLAPLLLGLPACRDSTSPSEFVPGLSIRTDAEMFHFVPAGTSNSIMIPVTLTNGTDETLHLAYCGISLERFTLRGWEMVYGPPCLAAVYGGVPIPAGTSQRFNFGAYDTPHGYEGFRFTDSPNVYRVRFILSAVSEGTSQPLPIEASVSNPFRVRR